MEYERIRNSNLLRNEEALLGFLNNKLVKNCNNSITVICAGHFMIMPDRMKENMIPAIYDPTDHDFNNVAKDTVGIFPLYTWQLGCSILNNLKKLGLIGKLSLLINDWQLVPPDNNREDSQPNKFRDSFYKGFKKLPDSYLTDLHSHGLSFPDDILLTEDGKFYLKEIRLRDRFLRKMKSTLIEKNRIVPVGLCSLNLNECGDVVMNTEDDESFSLTTNARPGCAGGICQMIVDIANKLGLTYSTINFVNLMPNGCSMPINVASKLAVNILSDNLKQVNVSITNIYFESYGVTNKKDFYTSFRKGVQYFEF